MKCPNCGCDIPARRASTREVTDDRDALRWIRAWGLVPSTWYRAADIADGFRRVTGALRWMQNRGYLQRRNAGYVCEWALTEKGAALLLVSENSSETC